MGGPFSLSSKGPLPHWPRPGYDLGARQSAGDPGEDIADLRAEYRQYRDDDNGYQYEYERILNQPLALLLWQIQHLYHLLSIKFSAIAAFLLGQERRQSSAALASTIAASTPLNPSFPGPKMPGQAHRHAREDEDYSMLV